MKIEYIGVQNDRYLLSYKPHPKYSGKYIGEFLDKARLRSGTDLRRTSKYDWFLDISIIDDERQLNKFLSGGG